MSWRIKGTWWCGTGHWTRRHKKIAYWGNLYCGPCWNTIR